MVEFVRKFIDQRVNQKIWFEYGLQILFVCMWFAGLPSSPRKQYPQCVILQQYFGDFWSTVPAT